MIDENLIKNVEAVAERIRAIEHGRELHEIGTIACLLAIVARQVNDLVLSSSLPS